MSSPDRFLTCLVALVAASCGDAEGDGKLRPAPVVPTMTPQPISAPPPPPAETSSSKDKKKGDRNDADWVPAEHKVGMAKWKDTGVYVDGKPAGFLTWQELPIALKPTWLRERVGANKRYGTNEPGWRWARERNYKFTDYLKAIGVDIRKVKEMHVYGPKYTQSVIATGKDLQSPLAQKFFFRFGGSVGGKAIPAVPEGFGGGHPPDKISSVMVYITKKPPTLVEAEDGFVLDGVFQEGVPYYGDPVRGGIRVYLDDKLAMIIKRQELDVKKATPDPDGEPRWKLVDVLAEQGVDTSKVVEMWTIRDGKRVEKRGAADLAVLTFTASSKAHGGVLLGENASRANAIAMHTRALSPDEMPYVTPDDE